MNEVVLELRGIRKECTLRRGLLAGLARRVAAVDGVSLAIRRGEVFGLVGESGCGKSTLSQIAVGLVPPTEGQVLFHDAAIDGLQGEARRGSSARARRWCPMTRIRR
jgi:ABC-type glutathione transport system ATPase component